MRIPLLIAAAALFITSKASATPEADPLSSLTYVQTPHGTLPVYIIDGGGAVAIGRTSDDGEHRKIIGWASSEPGVVVFALGKDEMTIQVGARKPGTSLIQISTEGVAAPLTVLIVVPADEGDRLRMKAFLHSIERHSGPDDDSDAPEDVEPADDLLLFVA